MQNANAEAGIRIVKTVIQHSEALKLPMRTMPHSTVQSLLIPSCIRFLRLF
jgi:hypothetical protein